MQKSISYIAYVFTFIWCLSIPTYSDNAANNKLDSIYSQEFYNNNEYTTLETNRSAELFYVPNEILIKFRREAANKVREGLQMGISPEQISLGDSLSEMRQGFRIKRMDPIFRNFKKKQLQNELLAQKDMSQLNSTELRLLRIQKRSSNNVQIPELDRIYKLEVESSHNQSLEQIVEEFNRSPEVEYAELNYIVTIDLESNDPFFPIQWPLNNIGQMYPESGKYNHPPGTPDADIDAPEAWDINTGNFDVIVAVADTGVDYNHRDIANNMWTNSNGYHGYDFVNSDNYPMDDNGHGTHCAGIIAAQGNNGLDITGVCWNAKIMALKFLDENGSGSYSNAAEAFYYAVNNGADIISNSWGKDDFSQTMQDAIDYAYSQGVIIVASAGNDNQFYFPHYPASMEHVISVAATNSKDEKASLSNCGDWIDISAPGVDVLSLRAAGTWIGKRYDYYTTIASGTSMACPHIAGILALLLSEYPQVSYEEILARLLDNADDISATNPAYAGQLGSGRTNAYKSLRFNSEAIVEFNRSTYCCDDVIEIQIRDFDIRGTGTQQITLTTNSGDSETVVLTEEPNHPWIFVGTIPTTSGTTNQGNSLLEVSDGEIITAAYADPNFGDGGSQIVEKTVNTDCVQPTISDIEVYNVTSSGARVKFKTDEPTAGQIRCGSACGGPYNIFEEDKTLGINHDFYIPDLNSQTDYYFVIDANDVSGNRTTSTNGGQCYTFSTTAKPEGLHVPSEYPTIQSAIDNAGNGDTVWVADGIYTGIGNRDIDFKGKAITVRSENGPEGCTVDCENLGRGFYFHTGEDEDSILDGFTVTHGRTFSDQFRYGGGIACYGWGNSPTIRNCIITENTAHNSGGGIRAGSATISNCIISNNSSNSGGGIYAGQATIINCVISDNKATYDCGGGITCWQNSDAHIINCLIYGNSAKYKGGGIHCASLEESIKITNCLITCNRTRGPHSGGGGIAVWTNTSPTITNCTLSFNYTAAQGDGIVCGHSTHPKITNCIFWNNGSKEIEHLYGYPIPGVTYSDIRGGWAGMGNINADPYFADPYNGDYHLQSTAGRWNPSEQCWVYNSITSPCVDSGNPSSNWTSELWPHAKRINMGAYGGTAEASMSNSSIGNIADLNLDDSVDFVDLRYLTANWLVRQLLMPSDLDRNGTVNLLDYATFSENWLWEE